MELTTYYTNLYTSSLQSDFNPSPHAPLVLGWLSDSERHMLMKEMAPEEVVSATASFPNGKTKFALDLIVSP